MLKMIARALALAGASFVFVVSVLAAEWHEDFSASPSQDHWTQFGETNLFGWDATAQNLAVTWDSSQPNSYFYHPLGTVLAKSDNFSFSFDLRLSDVQAGINPLKPGPFSLSVGLIDLGRATQTNFLRGTGSDAPELAEFSFFPDPGGAWIYGPSLTSILVDSTGTNWSTVGFAGEALSTGEWYHIALTYTASNSTLRTSITLNGQEVGHVSDAQLTTNFLDFRLNCLAICSYSDDGQDPLYAGSILAHGNVDNISIITPTLPIENGVGRFVGNEWQVQFLSDSNWVYTLERTEGFQAWVAASATLAGTGGMMTLSDTNAPGGNAFYRVRAQRP